MMVEVFYIDRKSRYHQWLCSSESQELLTQYFFYIKSFFLYFKTEKNPTNIT